MTITCYDPSSTTTSPLEDKKLFITPSAADLLGLRHSQLSNISKTIHKRFPSLRSKLTTLPTEFGVAYSPCKEPLKEDWPDPIDGTCGFLPGCGCLWERNMGAKMDRNKANMEMNYQIGEEWEKDFTVMYGDSVYRPMSKNYGCKFTPTLDDVEGSFVCDEPCEGKRMIDQTRGRNIANNVQPLQNKYLWAQGFVNQSKQLRTTINDDWMNEQQTARGTVESNMIGSLFPSFSSHSTSASRSHRYSEQLDRQSSSHLSWASSSRRSSVQLEESQFHMRSTLHAYGTQQLPPLPLFAREMSPRSPSTFSFQHSPLQQEDSQSQTVISASEMRSENYHRLQRSPRLRPLSDDYSVQLDGDQFSIKVPIATSCTPPPRTVSSCYSAFDYYSVQLEDDQFNSRTPISPSRTPPPLPPKIPLSPEPHKLPPLPNLLDHLLSRAPSLPVPPQQLSGDPRRANSDFQVQRRAGKRCRPLPLIPAKVTYLSSNDTIEGSRRVNDHNQDGGVL